MSATEPAPGGSDGRHRRGQDDHSRALAAALDVAYIDADDLHPASNVKKMSAGVPLDDSDRQPWLDLVGFAVAGRPEGVVVACSALETISRRLARARACLFFAHLAPSSAVLEPGSPRAARPLHAAESARIAARRTRAARADEAGVTIETTGPVDELVAGALDGLGGRSAQVRRG